MNSHHCVNQKLWDTKAEARARNVRLANLLKLELTALFRFGREKFDARRALLSPPGGR